MLKTFSPPEKFIRSGSLYEAMTEKINTKIENHRDTIVTASQSMASMAQRDKHLKNGFKRSSIQQQSIKSYFCKEEPIEEDQTSSEIDAASSKKPLKSEQTRSSATESSADDFIKKECDASEDDVFKKKRKRDSYPIRESTNQESPTRTTGNGVNSFEEYASDTRRKRKRLSHLTPVPSPSTSSTFRFLETSNSSASGFDDFKKFESSDTNDSKNVPIACKDESPSNEFGYSFHSWLSIDPKSEPSNEYSRDVKKSGEITSKADTSLNEPASSSCSWLPIKPKSEPPDSGIESSADSCEKDRVFSFQSWLSLEPRSENSETAGSQSRSRKSESNAIVSSILAELEAYKNVAFVTKLSNSSNKRNDSASFKTEKSCDLNQESVVKNEPLESLDPVHQQPSKCNTADSSGRRRHLGISRSHQSGVARQGSSTVPPKVACEADGREKQIIVAKFAAVELVKKCLEPYYQQQKITRDVFKFMAKSIVHKIVESVGITGNCC